LGIWPAPLVLLAGGSVRLVEGVIEIEGGLVTRMLRRGMPWLSPSLGGGAAAMTLGHVVWGRDRDCLETSRAHERVHVRQYERWGPLFIPAYLLAGAVARLRGFDPYLDNPFEREAYDEAP
jgi:hypothetical protein